MAKKQFHLVRVDFDDHSHMVGGHSEVVKCTVWGILYKETKEAYYVSNWMSDGEVCGMNSDTYCIRKHKGIKLTKIQLEV